MEEKGFLITFGNITNLFPRIKTTSRTGRVAGRMGYSGVITLRTEITVPNGACANTIQMAVGATGGNGGQRYGFNNLNTKSLF